MPSFNEIMRDAAKYPDTTEWTLPDGSKTTVGDLRTELRNTFMPKEDVTRTQQRAADERRQLEVQLYTLQQEREALKRQLPTQARTEDDFETYVHDPTWSPVAKRLKATQEKSERLEAELTAMKDRLANHEQVWWLNQHAQALQRIQANDADMKDQTKVGDFLNYAKNQGFSNLDTAYALYTRDRDIQRARETSAKEAYERAKTELGAPKIPSGANQSGTTTTITPPSTFASIDEAESLAANDPEIARLLDGVSS